MKETVIIMYSSFSRAGRKIYGEENLSVLKTWPKAAQSAVIAIMDKYGKPDIVSNELVIWVDRGVWATIVINKEKSKYNFPTADTDMMEQFIYYKVPADKLDELAKFDGSIRYDKRQGLLSARYDKEASNILALNLAHDIITGKKTVTEARNAFGKLVMQKMNGGDPEYMQKIMFACEPGALNADDKITGLDKHGKIVSMQ